MRIQRLFIILGIFLPQALFGADYSKALAGFPPTPFRFEAQGNVPQYGEAKQDELLHLLRETFLVARQLEPRRGPFFFSGAEPPYEVRFILTDRPTVFFEGQQKENDQSAWRILSFDSKGRRVVCIVLRTDKLYFNFSDRSETWRLAHFQSVLLQELYAFGNLHSPSATSRRLEKDHIILARIKYLEEAMDRVPLLKDPSKIPLYEHLAAEWIGYQQVWLRWHKWKSLLFRVAADWGWASSTNNFVAKKSMDEVFSTFAFAMHLVKKFPPPKAKPHIFSAVGFHDCWRSSFFRLQFNFRDTRDETEKSDFPDYPAFALERGESSGTGVILTRKRVAVAYHSVFWTDRLFYDASGNLYPDRLARMVLAFAGEFYGVIQPYLSYPLPPVAALQDQETARRQAAIAYFERLSESTVWKSFSPELRATFIPHVAELQKSVPCAVPVNEAASP